ncbi:MAG: TIGR03862 family flavoprotein [Pseudomonadota bacterium]
MVEAKVDVCVVGGGPAGLAAAGAAAEEGATVLLAEAMPTLGRKFLMAGKSGLNLTKDEPADVFAARVSGSRVRETLTTFGPIEIQAWAEGLGQPLFTGSSGRVFPVAMKASPLLRAWRARLADLGVDLRTRWRWTGGLVPALRFETETGAVTVAAASAVLALGGASWPRLGSDGAWAEGLGDKVDLAPFAASNAGLAMDWSPQVARFDGAPLKPVVLKLGETQASGEAVVTAAGLEGAAAYTLSAAVRRRDADERLTADLAPDLARSEIETRLGRPRGKASLANHLRRRLGLTGLKAALLREAGPLPAAPGPLAARIKAAPLPLTGLMPLAGAISSVGGVPEAALTADLMLRTAPGTFCAGEMIDWDAPTGGYLITASMASGRAAGQAAAAFAGKGFVEKGLR